MGDTEKICTTCKLNKPVTNFYKRTDAVAPYRSKCKVCMYQTARKWNKTNRVNILNHDKEKRYSNREKCMLKSARGRARKGGLECDITLEDINVPEYCPVLGLKLEFQKGVAAHNSPSLDRIDNSKGYIKGNVQVLSMRANLLKSDATLEEIEKLYLFLKGR